MSADLPAPAEQHQETVGELVRSGAKRLAEAGCASPQLDAELLVADVLATDRAGLRRSPEAIVGRESAERAEQLFLRRQEREPVAYLIGSRWFRRLELTVDRRVLIPRPESELLVEWAIELPEGASIVDVGTGSGAIALAIADERPDLRVSATDVDSEALSVAIDNAERLDLTVSFSAGNLLDAVNGTPDALVSNLPYVPASDLSDLEPEVAKYEPHSALSPGDGGLELITLLVAAAAERGIGRIALELGQGQASEVADAVRQAGWQQVEIIRDLAGIERVVSGCQIREGGQK